MQENSTAATSNVIVIIGEDTATTSVASITRRHSVSTFNAPAYPEPLIVDDSRKERRERRFGRHDSWKPKNVLDGG